MAKFDVNTCLNALATAIPAMGQPASGGDELRSRVAIDLSCCPLTRVSQRYSGLRFSIVEKQDLDGGRILSSLLVHRGREVRGFIEELAGDEDVSSVELIGETGTMHKVRLNLDCESCFVRSIAKESGLIPDDVVFDSGRMVLTFSLREHDEFRELLDQIKRSGAASQQVLELVQGEDRCIYSEDCFSRSGLTGRQLEVLQFAYSKGYFDRSRRINIGEISEEFGLHPSTISTHLRVGIHKVLDQMFRLTQNTGPDV